MSARKTIIAIGSVFGIVVAYVLGLQFVVQQVAQVMNGAFSSMAMGFEEAISNFMMDGRNLLFATK